MNQADQKMSKSIRVEHIRDGASKSEQIELRGMIRLEMIGLKASGEKPSRSERRERRAVPKEKIKA